MCRVVDADAAAEESKQDNEDVGGTSYKPNRRAFDAQVEVSGPDQRQHVARETADQTHQDGKVRDENSHEHRQNDDSQTQYDGPPAQRGAGRRTVAWREDRLRTAAKHGRFEQFHGGEVRQRVGQQRLGDQT